MATKAKLRYSTIAGVHSITPSEVRSLQDDLDLWVYLYEDKYYICNREVSDKEFNQMVQIAVKASDYLQVF